MKLNEDESESDYDGRYVDEAMLSWDLDASLVGRSRVLVRWYKPVIPRNLTLSMNESFAATQGSTTSAAMVIKTKWWRRRRKMYETAVDLKYLDSIVHFDPILSHTSVVKT